VDFISRHLADGIVVVCFAGIAVILLWPMTMDRRQRWRNRRAAKAAERKTRF
jgi:hypothetical protein